MDGTKMAGRFKQQTKQSLLRCAEWLIDHAEALASSFSGGGKDWKLTQVKTVNMGSLFRLNYRLTLKPGAKEKALDNFRD